jgi:excisionase family DNA binding protein
MENHDALRARLVDEALAALRPVLVAIVDRALTACQAQQEPEKLYLTVAEAADRWGVHEDTVRRHLADGMPHRRIGRGGRPRYRIPVADAEAWLADRPQRGAALGAAAAKRGAPALKPLAVGAASGQDGGARLPQDASTAPPIPSATSAATWRPSASARAAASGASPPDLTRSGAPSALDAPPGPPPGGRRPAAATPGSRSAPSSAGRPGRPTAGPSRWP